jgi:hypothetical protein
MNWNEFRERERMLFKELDETEKEKNAFYENHPSGVNSVGDIKPMSLEELNKLGDLFDKEKKVLIEIDELHQDYYIQNNKQSTDQGAI